MQNTKRHIAFGLAAVLGALGCAAGPDTAPVRQRVQTAELVDDDELPPPPGAEVAPVVPAEEIPGGVDEPDAEDAAEEQEQTGPAQAAARGDTR